MSVFIGSFGDQMVELLICYLSINGTMVINLNKVHLQAIYLLAFNCIFNTLDPATSENLRISMEFVIRWLPKDAN